MNEARQIFTKKLKSCWLPSFCDARDHSLNPIGFVDANLAKLSEFDAYWFLRGLAKGYVTEKDGFFFSEMSAAKEQIFWEGRKADNPRKISLWLEPIITIGALTRLIEEYRWPPSQVGLQSPAPWPFDLIGYQADRESEILACEVKKSEVEIDQLIEAMLRYCRLPPLEAEPESPKLKNAYRKIAGIRRSWPKLFWAVGPNRCEKFFKITETSETAEFSMAPVSSLHAGFENFNN